MKTPRIFIYRNPQFNRCPVCKGVGVLHHSRAKNIREQILKKITFYRLYRCKECGWRGLLSTIIFTTESLKAILLYLSLVFVTGYIIRFFLLKFIGT